MDETFLLTVENVSQASDTLLLIFPFLSFDKYHFDGYARVKIVTPDNQVIEKDVEFGLSMGFSPEYLLTIPNTQKAEIPVGSKIWIKNSLEQITRKRNPTGE